MINSCTLVGRIASDPEMRYTPAGMAVTSFRLAVARRKAAEGKDDTDFLDVVSFGKTAEFVAQYTDKGALVGIEGRIQSRTWQATDGAKRYAVEIVANSVQALETRQAAEQRRGVAGKAAPAAQPAAGGDWPAEDPLNWPVVDDPFGDD